MKLLGIDFGKRKIGLSFSEGLLASPLSTISVKTEKQVLAEVVFICNKLGIEKIVLGLSGGIHDKAAKEFGDNITKQTNLPVVFVDETLTSREAVAKMVEGKTSKKKRRVMEDSVAATIILNSYLEENSKL